MSLVQESGQGSASNSEGAQSPFSHAAELSELVAKDLDSDNTENENVRPRATPLPIAELIATLDANLENKQIDAYPAITERDEARRKEDASAQQLLEVARLEGIEASVKLVKKEIVSLRRSQTIALVAQALTTIAILFAVVVYLRQDKFSRSSTGAMPPEANAEHHSANDFDLRSFRVWVDSKGRKTRARVMEVTDGVVHLEKENGSIYKVPIERFSKEDRNILVALEESK